MPLYEYECTACGERTEALQAFSDPPLTVCPVCGGTLRKLLSPPAFQFKGTGWYVTDYGKSGQREGPGRKTEESTGESAKGEEGSAGGASGASTGTGAEGGAKTGDSSSEKSGGAAPTSHSNGSRPAPSKKKKKSDSK